VLAVVISLRARSFGDDANSVALPDAVAFVVRGCGVDLLQVVLDAARDGDQQQPDGPAHGPGPVHASAGQEDEAARCSAEGVATTTDGKLAVQNVEALVLTVMHMQRRPGPDASLQDAQRPARHVPRGLQAGIAAQASASRNNVPGQEIGHDIHDHPVRQHR
jgi:hypothetical protein